MFHETHVGATADATRGTARPGQGTLVAGLGERGPRRVAGEDARGRRRTPCRDWSMHQPSLLQQTHSYAIRGANVITNRSSLWTGDKHAAVGRSSPCTRPPRHARIHSLALPVGLVLAAAPTAKHSNSCERWSNCRSEHARSHSFGSQVLASTISRTSRRPASLDLPSTGPRHNVVCARIVLDAEAVQIQARRGEAGVILPPRQRGLRLPRLVPAPAHAKSQNSTPS